MEFETVKISDLISEISMGPFGSNIKVECFVDSGIPVLNGSNLDGFVLKEESFRYVTKEKADSLGKANASRGDIVITHRGTLGQIVFIPDNSLYDRYVISQSQFRVKCNEKVLPEYLVYYFHTMIGQHKLLSNASQVGVPALARASTTFQEIDVDIPSMNNQRKIVKLLEIIRQKEEVNNRINDNLSKQLKLIFQHYFFDDLHSNWPIKKLGSYLSLERGLSYKGKYLSDSAGVPMVNLGNILPNSVFRPEKLKYYTGDFKAKAIVKPGDIVVANTDLTQAREVLGSAILIPDLGCSTIICSHHISIVRNCKLPKFYVYGLLNSPIYRSRVIGFATGTTVLALPNETILNCEFSMPPMELIAEYESIAKFFYQKQELIRKENMQLSSIRDILLPKLMSGELDISDIEL